MCTEKTNKKEDEAKSANSESAPMSHGMIEMMSGCCTGKGGSTDCSTMMKGMMETMRSHPGCSPGAGDTESERREK